MNQRAQVSLVEAHSLREERRVNAPFVLGATESSRPIDDDLALAQAQVTAIEQPACEDLSEEPFVPGECCEQDERSDAGRHNPVACSQWAVRRVDRAQVDRSWWRSICLDGAAHCGFCGNYETVRR